MIPTVDQWKDIVGLQITTDFKNFLQNSQLAVGVPPLITDKSTCYDSDIFAGQQACGSSYFVHGRTPARDAVPGQRQVA